MGKKRLSIEARLKLYEEKLAAFKRDMEAIGVKVKVSASFGKYRSIVEEGE